MTSPCPLIPRFVPRHSSPPPGARSVEGRRRNPPPLACGSGEAGAKPSANPKTPLDLAALDRTAMRLLIVEDDRDAADYIARAFREVGHVADQAADGEEGLALALEREYDVLIVDRMLPKRDGLSRDRRTARQGRRHAGADPLRARPGRRPREGPARRRRRLPAQALFVLRAARPRRGAGAPPRRPRRGDGLPGRRSRARPAVAPGVARRRRDRCCSRASFGCSNI